MFFLGTFDSMRGVASMRLLYWGALDILMETIGETVNLAFPNMLFAEVGCPEPLDEDWHKLAKALQLFPF